MERYSATYGYTKGNFVLQNVANEDVRTKHYGVVCILKNLLQRGTPTIPSHFLLESLGDLVYTKSSPLFLISRRDHQWDQRIKGNNDQDNPALYFFENQIDKYLPEYAFIKQLILPEANIEEIVPDFQNDYYDRQVDFFLPQANLVIEIDGAQHREKVQRAKDEGRNEYLRKHHIKTIRINADWIKTENQQLLTAIDEIRSHITASKEIQKYKVAYERDALSVEECRCTEYDTVIRFQLLLLTLLQKNTISLEENVWEFVLINSQQRQQELFLLAAEDLFLWLRHLCKLNKLKFIKPNVAVTSTIADGFKAIKIDFDICKRWNDEADHNRDVVYIRNDYFDNKDYFQVSITDSIQYDLVLEGEDSDEESLNFLLSNIFGFDEFRDGQLPIIVNILKKIDIIGILPTGSGKSLCYQFAVLLQPCISFVVCPILALMYDQKENLDKLGITRTNFISSDKTGSEKDKILSEFSGGKYLFIWISPERFQSQAFRETVAAINYEKNFAIAVIDEVHCLSEWGHDFRTSYLTLVKTIKNHCPEARLLGLTATASQFVLNDIKNEFEIESTNIKTLSNMNRPELVFHLIRVDKRSKYDELVHLLKNMNNENGGDLLSTRGNDTRSGLIFTVYKSTKNGCVQIAQALARDFEVDIRAYHGGLGAEKKNIQHDYKNNQFPLLVATKAFGMGVDKPNIRYTIHYGLPWSIEAFYQEAGRAGRDRNTANCYILYEGENCDTEIIDKIFDINLDVSNLDTLQKELKNDLGSILFLWQQNNKGIERDLLVMRWVMQNLSGGKTSVIACNDSFSKAEVEKAIYKLSWLGFINDWTVEEWGETTGKMLVYQNDFTIDSVRDMLFQNIRRYDPGFIEENENYSMYFAVLKDESLKPYVRYMKMLLMWSYDNIVYQRRQAIKTMRDACERYVDGDTLKMFIENYFRFSDKTLMFDQVAYSPTQYSLWFELLYEYHDKERKHRIPITKDSVESLLPALQRYLESYRYNCGLNYLSGMLRLLSGKFNDSDGRPRLEDAFHSMGNLSEEDLNYIIAETLRIGKSATKEGREALGEVLSERYPSKAKQIYYELEDSASLTVVLNANLNRMKWIKEIIEW